MIKKAIRKGIQKLIKVFFGVNSYLYFIVCNDENLNLFHNKNSFLYSEKGLKTKLYPPYKAFKSSIGDYTYIAENSKINSTTIGKFCSIGPNLSSGWGIHPTNGISTHPMFYSTLKQNGMTLSTEDKIEETKSILIGNDVFLGMNVSILDGVTIGDGAVIGAGALVSKDIPPYAVAVGNPIRVINYRFDEKTIQRLLELKWWENKEEKLNLIEKHFFDIEEYLKIMEEKKSTD
ncbi:CatB-related O-acetyltransferase [Flavobacterium urumqiense]|uniref:Acetyltransferase (Isoleucine patch superfamily) n=1 Tax=Flavobacterium urumqiense TaxID=935224 RepID=A0A1H6ASG4_9FLAO|nr:CatB-related O-acetyltransferase [Flavobacterium urumqiense]SEG51114.1 Acetyltransferase (isoleucine patch superfamily) [Flavobacterium urumqiense]